MVIAPPKALTRVLPWYMPLPTLITRFVPRSTYDVGLIAQLDNSPVKRKQRLLGKQPVKTGKDIGTIRLPQRDHDNPKMEAINMRNGVEEIAIRGEQNGALLLRVLEKARITNPLSISPADIQRNVTRTIQQINRRAREVLVKQEFHDAATS